MTADQLLADLLDPGSYRSWDSAPADARPDPGYAAELARARVATGRDESVCTGEGRLGGRRVAVAVSEFGFLGGSIGIAAAQRLTLAVERATAERLPLIAAPASGGTRMQEGTVAFLQMAAITAAIAAHQAAGLPYLVYLRHPTTGGVFASWASIGHLTLAEPGALIGFLGPRVYKALTGSPIPDGVQTAENLLAHGVIDDVVPPGALAGYLGQVLTTLAAPPGPLPAAAPASAPAATRSATAGSTAAGGRALPASQSRTSAWESVLITRRRDRPGAADLIRAAATDIVRVREGGLILALARIGGRPCVLAGQDRTTLPHGTEALRSAQRGMRLAADLRLPLVTIIDTPGGELSPAAEEAGIAREIARTLVALITLPVPTISVLLGQGTGGAALALLPADRVLAAEHGWLAPLAPEGASMIVYSDTAHAPELAARQGIRSSDLAAAGVVDQIVAETNDGQLLSGLGRRLRAELHALTALDDDARLANRHLRYRRLRALSREPTKSSTDPAGCPGLATMAPGRHTGAKPGSTGGTAMTRTEVAIGAVAARAAVLAVLVGLAAGCSSSSSTGRGSAPAAAPASAAAASTSSPTASVTAGAFSDIIEPWDPGHPARSQSAPADCGGQPSTVTIERCDEAKTETADAKIDAVQQGRYATASPSAQAAILAQDRAWLTARGPVCGVAVGTGGTIDGINVSACLLAESTARLEAVQGIVAPEATLKSTDNTDPGALSWYTTPEGSRIAELDTQGDQSGGAIIAWIIIGGADGFVVNPSQFYFSNCSFTDPGVVQPPNPNDHRVGTGQQYQFQIDYTHLSAAPAGNSAEGFVYAPGTPVASWR